MDHGLLSPLFASCEIVIENGLTLKGRRKETLVLLAGNLLMNTYLGLPPNERNPKLDDVPVIYLSNQAQKGSPKCTRPFELDPTLFGPIQIDMEPMPSIFTGIAFWLLPPPGRVPFGPPPPRLAPSSSSPLAPQAPQASQPSLTFRAAGRGVSVETPWAR